jgi:dTDP-4-dehydrorhamnose reductase
MRDPLLVTGASGFLGWNVCYKAARLKRVIGIYCRNKIEIPGVTTLQADLIDKKKIKNLVTEIKPAAIIHTAAISKPDDCQQHPNETAAINVEASAYMADICAATGIPFVFTSSDLVFDGQKAPYTETDPTEPVNIYGLQKLTAEKEIARRYPEATICRMPLMFGHTESPHKSFTDHMITSLLEGRPLSLFIDEFRTPVDTASAAEGLLLALDFPPGQIFHLGGRQRLSRFEMGKMIERLMGIRNAQIRRTRQQDITSVAPRAADLSLDSSKAFSLGYAPDDIEHALSNLLQHRLYGDGSSC